nr:preprotein translocase subunit SecE [Thermoleophilaceae bacterium]
PGAPAPGTTPRAAGDGRDGTDGRPDREPAGVSDTDREPAPDNGRDRGGIAPPGVETETGAGLAASAPPETAGRSDTVLESPPPPPLLDDSSADVDAAGPSASAVDEDDERTRGRNKVIAFLIASWAELQRVQWPTRQQTTTLTGIVLGFVVIMGAYLGALDAVFSRLIQLII